MNAISFRHPARSVQVGKILCLGRNYADHAREMGSDIPTTPVVFMKPATALVNPGGTVILPPFSRELHHEVEMVVLIGRQGKNIPEASATDHIDGYAVGLDMTLRDVQEKAKERGLPWTVAKGFDTSAPVSLFEEKDAVTDPHKLFISLKVNGVLRQRSTTGSMIFRLEEIVSYLSTVFTLEPGDLIFTGTPEGVGPVTHGDVLEAELEGVASLRVDIA